jgi:hypothetical protein
MPNMLPFMHTAYSIPPGAIHDDPTDIPPSARAVMHPGIRKLCLALLESAYNDLNGGTPANRISALDWIRSEGGPGFTLQVVAETLGVDPDRLRAQLLEMPTGRERRIHLGHSGLGPPVTLRRRSAA